MLPNEQSHSQSKKQNNQRKKCSHLYNHRIHYHRKSTQDFSNAHINISNDSERIQSSKNLTEQEIQQQLFKTETNENENLSKPVEILDRWTLIMEELLRGGEFNRNEIPKTPLTPLLLETFDSLIALTKSINVTRAVFNDLALLLRSQRMDKKVMENFYNDEELYLGNILFLMKH
ncbi:unnamed protein product [Rotaria sordida]|uniref:Uncharacterized protein n=1 Tax=Rotaria sordida TaxID=392033 RepID=A0A815DM83_9BILA|nr:unnamed protein product [Rotaria sordida]